MILMNRYCQGCGSQLQQETPKKKGYALSLNHKYCQSCFRLRNYSDYSKVKAPVKDSDTFDFISSFDGTIFWVVDILNLEQSFQPAIIRHLIDKRVVLLLNKRDLLPQSVSNTKLLHGVMRLLKDYPLKFEDVQFVSAMKRSSLKGILPYLQISDVAFVGSVNAGKSSLLNSLLLDDSLSVSPVASTTASLIGIELEKYTLYDTPGFQNESPLLEHLNKNELQMISPKKPLKVQTFQIYERQALVFAGLGYLILEPLDKAVQVVSYLPFGLKRVKPDRALANVKQAEFMNLKNLRIKTKKLAKSLKNHDLEFFDLGFISIKGPVQSMELNFDQDVQWVKRKEVI